MKIKLHQLAAVASAAVLIALCGCQTRITAEKFPEKPLAVQKVVTVNGEDKVITESYVMASGGWYVTARSPLWAKEGIRGLDVGAKSDGEVWLKTDQYDRDLSTNAVTVTDSMFAGGAALVDKVAAAYATIATGGGADLVSTVARKAYSLFTSGGGRTDAAKVETSDGGVTITDGSTCVTCDPDGNCTLGSCSD